MNGRSSNKGIRGERELVHILSMFYPNARRGRQKTGGGNTGGKQSPDVEGTPIWIECKRGKTIRWRGSFNKAKEEAAMAGDSRPVVLLGREDRGEWMAFLPLEDLIRMIKT